MTMEFYPTLEETLAKRFTDMDEVRDISEHGIMGGYPEFTYTYDLDRFFDEFEYEIEDKLYDIYGETWLQWVVNNTAYPLTDTQSLRNYLVWFVVEDFCQRKAELVTAA